MAGKLIIAHAVPEDAEDISKLANSLRVDVENPQEGGFIAHPYDADTYLQRITGNPFVYIARIDGEAVGYSIGFTKGTLEEKMGKEIQSEDDDKYPIFHFLQQQDAYVYVDQWGIARDYARKGIGKALVKKCNSDMIERGIFTVFAGIWLEPYRNQASLDFTRGLGFVQVSELVNSNGHKEGIYRLNLPHSE